ncbi:MAG: pyrophosphohydrolase [Candidatus Levybacteria bacterium]|nr:pyrophosphohydrolase [Candidatus Levybacteria bacterium]
MQKGIDCVGVSVSFFCHDGRGNFLLNKRSKKSRDEYGTWDPGGGAIEVGETVADTLKREIREEYCADIINSEFLGFRDIHRINEKGNKTHWITLDFKVLIDREEVKNGVPDKHSEIGWFKLDNLPKPLHSQFPLFLKKYKEKLF